MNDDYTQLIKKDEVLCVEGDLSYDLYRVIKGKLLICKRKNSMVTPIAYLTPGEFLGEMSFFDKHTRSADVIALEDTELLRIPSAELKKQFPMWLTITAKSMTRKIRQINTSISNKGIKRNTSPIKPLSIEEQRHYFKLFGTE